MRLFKVLIVLITVPLIGGVLGAIIGSLWVENASRSLIHLSLGIGFFSFPALAVSFAVRELRKPAWRGMHQSPRAADRLLLVCAERTGVLSVNA